MFSLLFSSKGRIDRRTYLAGYFGILFVVFIAGKLLSGIHSLVVPLLGLVLLIGCLNLTIKRFHDTGKSTWWISLFFLPIVNFIAWVYLLLAKGQKGDNLYGSPFSIFSSKALKNDFSVDESSSRSELQDLLDKRSKK